MLQVVSCKKRHNSYSLYYFSVSSAKGFNDKITFLKEDGLRKIVDYQVQSRPGSIYAEIWEQSSQSDVQQLAKIIDWYNAKMFHVKHLQKTGCCMENTPAFPASVIFSVIFEKKYPRLTEFSYFYGKV